jgi:hypothetical protein
MVSGTLAVGTNAAAELRPSAAFTAVEIFAAVKTAPTGAALLVTVRKNGVAVGTVTIADGAFTGTQTSLSITAFVKDDKITVDIDQVGSVVAGADLSVALRGTR